MDREKQAMTEESSTSDSKLTGQATSTTSTTSETNKDKNLLKTNDDNTSTESSDTFESWTILNDKEKPKAQEVLNVNASRIEILNNSDHGEEEEDTGEKEEHNRFKEIEKQDSCNDDLSDGISIISESESVGRISPHPYIRDHLHDLNFKFSLSDHMDDTILNRMREEMENETVPLIVQDATTDDHNLRQRRKSSTHALEAKNQALQKASQTTIAPVHNSFPPVVRKGLQGIFLVGVALAILALIGKILNPTWQPLPKAGSSSGDTAQLEQKLNDMELQNNLMRAEIDLLNKQVKYLSTLNDPYQQKYQGKYKDDKGSKTFKAWSGNGDTLKPLDITKQDLRAPYKCPDGSFVEIANMCIEKRSKDEPSLVDQFGKVIEDLKEQSEVLKTFEQVAEELQGFQDNPFEQIQTEETQHEFIKNKPIYQPPEEFNQKLPYKDKYQKQRPKGDFHSSAPYKQYKQRKYEEDSKHNKEYRDSFGKEFNKDSKEFKTRNNNSKERGEYNNNSKERKYRQDNSRERFNKQYDNDKSNENSKENHSKDRYNNNNNNNKQKRKYNKNGSDEDFSGEWQTNYMKHRENQRKNNEQKYQDNKNWYIKRGDSREHKRSGEKQYR